MKVFINNFSMNCALGNNKAEVASSLFDNAKEEEKPSLYKLVDGQSTPVLQVKKKYPEIPGQLKKHNSRNNQLILMNLLELKDDIDFFINKFGPERVGIICGTSTSGIEEGIEALKNLNENQLPFEFDYAVQEMGSPSLFIKDYLSLKSIAYTISTACSSGGRMFIEAKALLKKNLCDVVLVAGSDTLNDLTLNGFHCLEAISTEKSNPMSKNRRGINIGEGASLFILSKEPSSLELLGVGESSDAYHVSSPDPEGDGAISAMKMALEDAGLDASEIDYINLHGTGTIKNDEMEAKAVSFLFKHDPPASSTKPLIGHTLGAAGGLELGFCALAVGKLNPRGRLPLHFWDGEVDEKLEKLNLVTEFKNYEPRICMSNSYAFGGNNVSLIIGKTTHE